VPNIDTTLALIGVSYLWTAPGDTAKPATSIAYGGAMGGAWTYVGGTQEGVSFSREIDVNRHYWEEQLAPVKNTPGQGTVSVSCNLGEATMQNLKLAFGSGALTTASGITTLTLSETLDTIAVVLDGVNPQGLFRRIYIPRANSVASLEVAGRRTEELTYYPLTLESVCRLNEIVIDNDDA